MKKSLVYVMSLVLVVATITAIFSFKNINSASEIVTVKVIQTFNNRWSSAFIAYGDGRVEERELPRLKFIGESNLKESNQAVIKILNELKGNGYRFVSSGSGMAENVMYEVYVFEK